MQTKAFKRFYLVTTLILTGAAAVPVWHFSLMVCATFFREGTQYNVTAVIPFMAVTVTILVGFLLLSLIKNLPVRKSHVIIFSFSTLAFIGLSLLAESLITSHTYSYTLMRLTTSRMIAPPEEFFSYHMVRQIVEYNNLPFVIRVHYYIFSVVLAISVVSWLYNFTQAKPGKRFCAFQGIITACYALAYFFVRVMQYENFAARQLTWGSVLNAAVCFILASLAMGVWGISFLRNTKYVKIIPVIFAVLTGVLLYIAQYFMLDGQFYLYGESSFMSMLLRIFIVILPGVLVYLLLKKFNILEETL